MLNTEWCEAIEGFLAHERAGGKRSTTNGARRQHLQHLARRVTVGPWGVTADVLFDYLSKQDWSTETRRGRRNTFIRFYVWAQWRGFVVVNPAETLPKIKMNAGRARPAPDRAYHEALMAARPREKLMLRLAAEVGMRRGEVAVVHSKDLMEDLVGHSLIVHGKGGKQRVVPLPQSLGRALAHAEPGYLFPGHDDGHLSPRYVGKLIRDLLPGDWTMHTLRHRFGTRAYALTSDLLLVQEMLGHASPTTTRRYVQYDRDRMRAAVDELAVDELAG
jgi:integrase/recombinase XerC